MTPEPITPLLKKLAHPLEPNEPVQASEVAGALTMLLEDKLNETQAAALLSLLHYKKKDQDIAVIDESIPRISQMQPNIEAVALKRVISERSAFEGNYLGGFCEIVGTAGSATPTIPVTTTASIVTSVEPENIIASIKPTAPALTKVAPENVSEIYKHSKYAFLPELNFYPGTKFTNPVRRELDIRTIFDLISTLLHLVGVNGGMEARVVGVSNSDLGPVLAQAIRDTGVRKVPIVSGHGFLDRISPEGVTSCWMFSDRTYEENVAKIQHFTLQPLDFGVPIHPLHTLHTLKAKSTVNEDAKLLVDILHGSQIGHGEHGKDIPERGPGGCQWKEGLRRARWCIHSGEALRSLEAYIRATSII
ncbi:glycosyl transferase [Aspergillus alliaceus]|uniref:glycosyl transferase n=1 Tax=Petromyces alliaceus TaxID=209559 RepID=UPI0012A4897E|nr:glycosyl transferase [Aspergillus alliaceus]KAB8230764.1 glycosyl transferase [Aspergillus alliaceus]